MGQIWLLIDECCKLRINKREADYVDEGDNVDVYFVFVIERW